MKNDIKLKQVCAIFLAVMPITKLITAPSIFAGYCNEKLWQPVVLLFLVDILLVLMLTFVMKNKGNLTFFELLKFSYGNFFAKFVLTIYVVYFLLKGVIPLIEHKEFIDSALYETLPRSTIFYPAFAVIFYMCYKGLKSYARGIELCFFIAMSGLFLLFFLSVTSGEWNYLLPIFKGTTAKTPICALKSLFWFNDGIYLIVFMGHFKLKKHTATKLVASYSIAGFLVVLFFATFYSIFRYIAPTQKIALSAVGIFSVSLVNVGRFDYVATFLITLTGLFAIALPMLSATIFLKDVLSLKSPLVPSIIVCGIMFVVLNILSTKYYDTLKFFIDYLTPVFWICGYLLPCLALGGKKYAH